MSRRLDVAAVKEQARGQWQRILPALGIDTAFLVNKHRSCPGCGGSDRFRFDNMNGDGTFICSRGTGENIAGDGIALLRHVHGWDLHTALERVAAYLGLERQFLRSRRRVATYDYVDADGVLRYQVLRFEPKSFQQRRPNERGGWDWSTKGIERLPYRLPQLVSRPNEPVFVVEGEKAVDTLIAMGLLATTNCGGAGNWTAELNRWFEGRDVVVLPDNDPPGERHADVVQRELGPVARSVRVIRLPGLALHAGADDWLAAGNSTERLHELVQSATPKRVTTVSSIPTSTGAEAALEVGSDVEIAAQLGESLRQRLGEVVHDEGSFWHYTGTHWATVPAEDLRRSAHAFDGRPYRTAAGRQSRIMLNKGRIDSILNETAVILQQPEYFRDAAEGINCASGFIRFDGAGVPHLEAHDSSHRQRHVLPGRWSPGSGASPTSGSLLQRLLEGCFKDDPEGREKVALLAEICGVAALGYATRLTQPRAVVLSGPSAENGKSQVLDLARGLLPATAISSVTAGRFGDERHVVGLLGKLLNASDELSSSAPIASSTFKAIVTGDPVEGRDVYRSRVEFRPVAQHIFATNVLPSFQKGFDRGVMRRLIVIPFERVVPKEERIVAIGQRIAREEPDLLLAWAIDGASRVLRHRAFTVPASCERALRDWAHGSDPVLAWLDECTEVVPIHSGMNWIKTSKAYEMFFSWATRNGYRPSDLLRASEFTQHVVVNAPGVDARRMSTGRKFYGLVVRGDAPGARAAA